MVFRVTIKHSKNDGLLSLVEHDIHKRIPGVLSGILKDMMTDGSQTWWQLEFFMEERALNTLHNRLFWAEIQAGCCLSIPVLVEEVPDAIL